MQGPLLHQPVLMKVGTEQTVCPMSNDVILMNGLGIVASDLVPAGTVAIMLRDGAVRVVPAEKLRATVDKIGSENLEGLSMAPPDFKKLQAVVERQREHVDATENIEDQT